MKANYIGGEWVASDAASRNINPSNTDDIIDEFARAGRDQVAAADLALHHKPEAFEMPLYRQVQKRLEHLLPGIGILRQHRRHLKASCIARPVRSCP